MRPGTSSALKSWLRTAAAAAVCLGLAASAAAKTEKPTVAAEDFFRFLAEKQYAEAADLLCGADVAAIKQLAAQAAGSKDGKAPGLATVLEQSFGLMQAPAPDGPAGGGKKQDPETLMPRRIGFFVPGQYYVVGNFAAVFTRETYELAHADTGPVRDDPRKLWVDPTNALSKVRDEAFFKQWWVWENDNVTMPGLIWMIKEKNVWKIDFFGGAVPRKAFQDILRWHFGRDVFEEEKPKTEAPAAAGKPGPAGGAPGGQAPAAPPAR